MSTARTAAGVLFAVLVGVQPLAHAGSTDGPSADALSAAIAALGQASPGSPGTPALDPKLGAIERSPDLGREFTDLAGAVLGDLAAAYDGDPARMAAAVEKGRSDPDGFLRSLPPATRAKLQALAGKLDSPAR